MFYLVWSSGLHVNLLIHVLSNKYKKYDVNISCSSALFCFELFLPNMVIFSPPVHFFVCWLVCYWDYGTGWWWTCPRKIPSNFGVDLATGTDAGNPGMIRCFVDIFIISHETTLNLVFALLQWPLSQQLWHQVLTLFTDLFLTYFIIHLHLTDPLISVWFVFAVVNIKWSNQKQKSILLLSVNVMQDLSSYDLSS